MKRKILALILVLVVTFSFVACAAPTDTQTTDPAASEAGESTFEYKKVVEYPEATAIENQASFDNLAYAEGEVPLIAYMPSGLEFTFYQALGQGVYDLAEELGVEVVTLAPQSGSDIDGQMGMIQDAISMGVDAILLNPHDDSAAAPLVEQATAAGIVVFNINSDSTSFPAPIHGVIGYNQFDGNVTQAQAAAAEFADIDLKIGVIEGLPGYHNDMRTGGFLEGIKDHPSYEVISSINGGWNVDGGNVAAMDMLQANPEINMIYCANDQEATGAVQAFEGLGRSDIIVIGNDGDTNFLELIYEGKAYSTLNTVPFEMGRLACQAAVDALYGEFSGGFAESPGVVTNEENVLGYLQDPNTVPAPSKEY